MAGLLNTFIHSFIYLWLRWVFVAARGLSLAAASGGFSCCGAGALGVRASVVVARGLWSAGSVVVAHGLSCSAACGIFPDQGSNPCPCIGRRILSHCATREVLSTFKKRKLGFGYLDVIAIFQIFICNIR